VVLHRAADEAINGMPKSSGIPDAASDAKYLENHRGHLMFVKPEERQYVTAELIRETSFTATEAELKKRIGDLADAGYSQFTIQIVPGQEDAIEDWGRIRRSFA